MKKSEIEEKIKEFFAEESKTIYTSGLDINIVFLDNTCTISLSQMYEGIYNFCKFKHLQWLSDLLGTEEIDLENGRYRSGCESCDYGSEDYIEIVCYNIKAEDEVDHVK